MPETQSDLGASQLSENPRFLADRCGYRPGAESVDANLSHGTAGGSKGHLTMYSLAQACIYNLLKFPSKNKRKVPDNKKSIPAYYKKSAIICS
ncbi:MAG: hypothetical protein WCC17_22330 [Candidatus Nitrosopolaris sp.]